MVRMGLGHARTAMLCYVAMGGSGSAALMAHALVPYHGGWLLPVWLMVYAFAAHLIDLSWQRFQASNLDSAR